jgi:hypothetical protein
MFLFAALSWIRLRLVAPEMMVFVFMVTSTSIVLWIKENPVPHVKFVLLGVSTALGYLFKSFFFPFSTIFFVLAGLVSGPLKKAAPRLLLAAVVMLVVSGPLIFSLSRTVGRFSFGEVGNFCYTTLVAGEGELTNPPAVLAKQPSVLFYKNNPFVECTRPAGFDPCYWNEGVKPVVHLVSQLKVVPGHVRAIVLDSPWLFVGAILWLMIQWRIGTLSLRGLWPPSVPLILLTIAAAGTGMYCLVHVEMRYLAAFLSSRLWLSCCCRMISCEFRSAPKVPDECRSARCTDSGNDAQYGGGSEHPEDYTRPGRRCHREAFFEMLAIKDCLNRRGVEKGEDVAWWVCRCVLGTTGRGEDCGRSYRRNQLSRKPKQRIRLLILKSRQRVGGKVRLRNL